MKIKILWECKRCNEQNYDIFDIGDKKDINYKIGVYKLCNCRKCINYQRIWVIPIIDNKDKKWNRFRKSEQNKIVKEFNIPEIKLCKRYDRKIKRTIKKHTHVLLMENSECIVCGKVFEVDGKWQINKRHNVKKYLKRIKNEQ